MSLIGNIIWIIFGGIESAIGYISAGIVLCCTIVGIPFGLQLFKIGLLALCPFGQEARVSTGNNGCLSTLLNLVWICTGGICIALIHLFFGLLLCITIVGIPFGLQHFKLMGLAFTPFGREIVSK